MTYYRLESKIADLESQLTMANARWKFSESENARLQVIVDAASYCCRHGYIDKGAVLFTGIDKALNVPFSQGEKESE